MGACVSQIAFTPAAAGIPSKPQSCEDRIIAADALLRELGRKDVGDEAFRVHTALLLVALYCTGILSRIQSMLNLFENA